jgi:hypothetical protein
MLGGPHGAGSVPSQLKSPGAIAASPDAAIAKENLGRHDSGHAEIA